MMILIMKCYCRLCGAELNKANGCAAHIIPEFIWREYMTNEDGHREEMILLKKDNMPPRFLRKYGITDNTILCRKCDGEILGKYENDFKEVWEKIFKNGKLYPVEKDGELRGWAKELSGHKDIIAIKLLLFILCCIWRASISTSEDYPIKLNNRKEKALRKILSSRDHDRLLHSYSMICSKFEDGDYSLAVAPYFDRRNRKKLNLVRFYLPLGYVFTIRLGLESIDKKLGIAKFNACSNAFFIANMGKLEGSVSEVNILSGVIRGLRNMYPDDKRRIERGMLEKYDDISSEDVLKVLNGW